ncbi:MAG: hypothetical protein Q7S74_04745 [Nanoarchaeota archaeon]|nr:hypothetical protein [Nanoarchaeota archaeon]
MAKNLYLENAVLSMMYHVMKFKDRLLLEVSQGNADLGREFLREASEALIDTEYKVKFFSVNVYGYGYDFTKADEKGKDGRELFNSDLVKIGKNNGRINGERFISQKIVRDRFGCYITTTAIE